MYIPSDSGEVLAWSGVQRLCWSNHGASWTAHWKDKQQLAGCKVGVWGDAVCCPDLGCAEPCDRATGESTCIMHGAPGLHAVEATQAGGQTGKRPLTGA
jgi:hypothetical protein